MNSVSWTYFLHNGKIQRHFCSTWLLVAPIYPVWVWQSFTQILLKCSIWRGRSSLSLARNLKHIEKDDLSTDTWRLNWNDKISDSILKQENMANANSLHFSNISDIRLKNLVSWSIFDFLRCHAHRLSLMHPLLLTTPSPFSWNFVAKHFSCHSYIFLSNILALFTLIRSFIS